LIKNERPFEKAAAKTTVDVALIIDCTLQMGSYLDEIQKEISNLYDELRANLKNYKVRVGIVTYRDYDLEEGNIDSLDFTDDITSMVD